MTSTTIKVTPETRDRLKRAATSQGQTLGQYLRSVADRAERDARMRQLKNAIADTPPELMQSWREEAQAWERAELTDARKAL